MKKVCAVWMAALRPLLGWIMGLLVLLAVAEIGLFQWGLARAPWLGTFGEALRWGGTPWVFRAALVLLCAMLCLQGCQLSGGKMGYTLARLPLSEKAATALWALAHMGCIVILWAWQLAVTFVLWRCYARAVPANAASNLMCAINFYDSVFLHNLLPLADGYRHVRNILWVLSLGPATAAFGYFQRRGHVRKEVLLLALLGLWSFSTDISTGLDIAFSVAWLLLLASVVYGMWEVSQDEDENENGD